MEKLRIFFSYSHADGTRDLIEDLQIPLRGEFESFLDVQFIQYGEHITSRISEALFDTDLMVPILTERAIASTWVLTEMVRADERGVTLIPIVEDSLIEKLPAFLRDRQYVAYKRNEIFGLKGKIVAQIKHWLERIQSNRAAFEEKRNIRQHVIALQRWIQKRCQDENGKEMRPLQLTLIETILSTCKEEVEAVKSLNYRQNIGREREFIIRAQPVFKAAAKVLATSVDTVSTFWDNEELQRHTRDYIRSQNPNATFRLFVFANADNAHKYGNLLFAHYEHYGTSGGGVFLCSLDAYRQSVLPRIAERHHAERLLTTDFALLTYAIDGTPEVLEATLDQSVFTVSLHKAGEGLVNRNGIERMFEDLISLRDGEINDTYQVLRWSPKFLARDESECDHWAEVLKRMFGGRYGDIYHMVFFSRRASEQLDSVLEVKNAILKLKDDLKRKNDDSSPTDVWFGSRIALQVNDSVGGGPIDVGDADEMPYVLAMKFSSKAALEKYYENHAHSDARRTLYEKLNSDFTPLYSLIDKHPDDVKKAIWNVINQMARDWLERRDYVDDETFKYVARRPIPPFAS